MPFSFFVRDLRARLTARPRGHAAQRAKSNDTSHQTVVQLTTEKSGSCPVTASRWGALFKRRGPAWRSADQVQIFSTSLRLQVRIWLYRSGSVRSLRTFRPFLSYTPFAPELAVHAMMIMPQLPTPGSCNPLLSSTSPRLVAPSCWPAQSSPASSACARVFALLNVSLLTAFYGHYVEDRPG